MESVTKFVLAGILLCAFSNLCSGALRKFKGNIIFKKRQKNIRSDCPL